MLRTVTKLHCHLFLTEQIGKFLMSKNWSLILQLVSHIHPHSKGSYSAPGSHEELHPSMERNKLLQDNSHVSLWMSRGVIWDYRREGGEPSTAKLAGNLEWKSQDEFSLSFRFLSTSKV